MNNKGKFGITIKHQHQSTVKSSKVAIEGDGAFRNRDGFLSDSNLVVNLIRDKIKQVKNYYWALRKQKIEHKEALVLTLNFLKTLPNR